MSPRETFDDALDATIDSLTSASRFEHMLAVYPEHRDALRPLLDTAVELHRGAQRSRAVNNSRMSPDLAANFSVVRAALQRAQISSPVEPTPLRPQPTWWRRRVASLSLPVIALMAAIGITGATAGTYAVSSTTGVPGAIDGLIAGHADHAPPIDATQSAPQGDDDASPAIPGTTSDRPPRAPVSGGGLVNRQARDVAGFMSGVSATGFHLSGAGGDWQVTLRSDTRIEGEIAEGSSAVVQGVVTTAGAIEASSVHVTPSPPVAADAPVGGADPTAPAIQPTADHPDHPTPPPKPTRTPRARVDSGPAER